MQGTVKGRILALQDRKRKLADTIYGQGRKGQDLPIDAATSNALLAGD